MEDRRGYSKLSDGPLIAFFWAAGRGRVCEGCKGKALKIKLVSRKPLSSNYLSSECNI